MYVNAHIKVLINGVQIYSIVGCEMENDGHNVGATCDIIMPLNARIQFNGQDTSGTDTKEIQNGYLTAPIRYLFNTGDHIIIKAKYDGYESYSTESDKYVLLFEGFLMDFYLGTPIKIKCLDYVYWFNLGNFGDTKLTVVGKSKTGKILQNKTKSGTGCHYDKVEFKKLILDLLNWVNSDINEWNDENGTNVENITLIEPMFDMTLVDITFINQSPAAVLEYFKRELGLAITLMGSKLYINVASFTTSVVKLDTGINILKSELQTNNLKNHRRKNSKGANSVFLRIKLKAWFIKENGTKDSIEVGDDKGELVEQYFYNVVNKPVVGVEGAKDLYEQMANEALQKAHQGRFTGEVETPLYPIFDLFWKVVYLDRRYPEKNGNYVCTSQKVKIGEEGYHRISKLAFLDDVL